LPEQTLKKDRLDPRLWRIVSVAVLGSFLSQLDATVVNVSLSSVAAELHSSLSVIQWVTSGYLLALALMSPLNGWLVERIGLRGSTTLSRPRIAKRSSKIMECQGLAKPEPLGRDLVVLSYLGGTQTQEARRFFEMCGPGSLRKR
jgi:hypothetical protein